MNPERVQHGSVGAWSAAFRGRRANVERNSRVRRFGRGDGEQKNFKTIIEQKKKKKHRFFWLKGKSKNKNKRVGQTTRDRDAPCDRTTLHNNIFIYTHAVADTATASVSPPPPRRGDKNRFRRALPFLLVDDTR